MLRLEEVVLSPRESRFRTLYEIHAGAVARYAARRVPPDDVHDVIAETFLTAWRRLEDVPDDALPWLFGTARRHIANRHRSTRRRRALNDRLVETRDPTGSHAAGIETSAIDGELVDAIRRLPAGEREAFMLVAWDGLDPKRAARAAGCSGPAFRVRLHRARSRLKRDLASPPLTERAASSALTKTQMEEAR